VETIYLQGDGSADESHKHSDEATLSISRSDFGALMDDFLENYEVLGRKMHHRLEGQTGAERLGELREAMGKDHDVGVQSDDGSDNDDDYLSFEEDDDRGDCETVISMCRCSFR
jgi:protein LTV1